MKYNKSKIQLNPGDKGPYIFIVKYVKFNQIQLLWHSKNDGLILLQIVILYLQIFD